MDGNEKGMMGNLEKLAAAIERAGKQKKQNLFLERRAEVRLWCSELVQVWLKDITPGKSRWKRKGTAVLEDISHSGLCLQLEDPLPHSTPIRVKHPEFTFEGTVRYCVYREEGYFIGVQLNEKSKWSENAFKPQHLLDPSQVVPPKKSPARKKTT